MIRLANVLIVHSDAAVAEAFAARLSHNGYHAQVATSSEQALPRLKGEHLDLIILGQAIASALDLTRSIRATEDGRDVPLVLVADTVDAALAEAALANDLDDAIAWDCNDAELFARLRPLVRLATMRSELDQRVAVARAMGDDITAETDSQGAAPPRILVVGQDLGEVSSWLADMGEAVRSQNLYDAESQLETRNFDAAVVCVGTDPAPFLAFASQVRNNPRLFNLPLVMLTTAPSIADDAYRHGVSRVLPRMADIALIRAVVKTLVRRQQLRWAIRGALSKVLAGKSRDPMTGTYSRAFLDHYLQARLSTAQAHQRHLAVVFFSIPNVDGVRSHFGDDAAEHLVQQLGQWISGLLRAEDLNAYYAPNQFCVVLPDTPLVEADVVMHRIAGVLAYTDFAVREVYQPVKVWVQVGSTNAKPTDTAEQLLGRARAKLD
ncbi:response regulator [Paramagnetospirillum marisnigri]|uniref:Response regulator n=1 Tax=Paramagnetospirillum marisnigri TaxID=1285242 RepID=A0A178M666_9PROT|nr:diguanylate cyclase [Paramagnetospirillum marisnigri]OAN44033.1 response regulator [Paramagnetospirillum marisnigri]